MLLQTEAEWWNELLCCKQNNDHVFAQKLLFKCINKYTQNTKLWYIKKRQSMLGRILIMRLFSGQSVRHSRCILSWPAASSGIIILNKTSQSSSEMTGGLLQMFPHRIRILGHTFDSFFFRRTSPVKNFLIERWPEGWPRIRIRVGTDRRTPPAISNEGWHLF